MTKTEIVLLIITGVSVLSPLLSAYITSRYNLKIEKLKLFDTERIKALNEFIEKSNNYFKSSEHSFKLHNSMTESFLKLQVYFKLDNSTCNKLFIMERKGNYEEDWNLRNNLIQKLSYIINKHIK